MSLILFIYGHGAAAAMHGAMSPLGARGSNPDLAGTSGGAGAGIPQWKEEWSQAYFKCAEMPEVKEYFKKISNGEVSDIGPGKPWCSNSDVYRPENTSLFQLGTFKILAKPESGYRPEAMNPNSPNPPAVGLFQIGPTDVAFHKCRTPDGQDMNQGGKQGAIQSLKKPENNVCCALQIAARVAADKWKVGKSQSSGKLVFADGKKGTMGGFWEPMRVQNSKGAKGEQMRSEINTKVCSSFNAGGTFTTAELSGARRSPASGGGSTSAFASLIGNATGTR
jgi:hypothetical protein